MSTHCLWSRGRRRCTSTRVWIWCTPPSLVSSSNSTASRSMELTLSDRCSAVGSRSASLHTSSSWLYRPLWTNTEAAHWNFECILWRLEDWLLSAALLYSMDRVRQQVTNPQFTFFLSTEGIITSTVSAQKTLMQWATTITVSNQIKSKS